MARLRGLQQIFQSQDTSDPLLSVSAGVTTLSFLSTEINFDKDGTGTLLKVVDPNKLLFTLAGGTTHIIGSDSSDGSDNRLVVVSSNSTSLPTRGSALYLYGNEHPSFGGNTYLWSGDTTNSIVDLNSYGSNGNIIFRTANTPRWFISAGGSFRPQINATYNVGNATENVLSLFARFAGSGDNTDFGLFSNNVTRWLLKTTGHILPNLDNTYDIGSPTFRVRNIYADNLIGGGGSVGADEIQYTGIANVYKIYADTADASDTKAVNLCGGGSESTLRGSVVEAYGNEHANAGKLILRAGAVSGANLQLHSNNSSIDFTTGGSLRWSVENDGNFVGVATNNIIRTNTSDGTDNKSIILAGGGAYSTSRGSFIAVWGNENGSGLGRVDISGGDTPDGNINLTTNNASSNINLTVAGARTIRFARSGGATWYFNGNNGEFQWTGTNIGFIGTDTSDGSDNRGLYLGAGGGGAGTNASLFNRTGSIVLSGNEYSGGPAGAGGVYIQGGAVATGNVTLRTSHASSAIRFNNHLGQILWSIDNATSTLVQGTNGTGGIQLGNPAGTQTAKLQVKDFGYSAGWKGLFIGDTDTTYQNTVSLWFNVDLSANPSASFTGAGFEYYYRNASVFGTPNATNDAYHYYLGFKDGDVTYHPATGTPNFIIRSNTSDTTDDKSLTLCGGGGNSVTRGAQIFIGGNENVGGAGDINLTTGDISGGNITLNAYNANSVLYFYTANAVKWQMAGSNLLYHTNANIISSTADGFDTSFIIIGGGGGIGTNRGAAVQVYGNDNASFGGLAYLNAGADGSRPNVELVANHASLGNILFKTQNITRFSIDPNGHLIPFVNATYDVGSTSNMIRGLFVGGEFRQSNLYYSSQRTISVAQDSTGWVKLCSISSPGFAKIRYYAGSVNSEEYGEIEILTVYHSANTQIKITKNTYNYHIDEIRVTSTGPGQPKVIYVKIRTTTAAPGITWHLLQTNSPNSVVIHNIEETPGSGTSLFLPTTGTQNLHKTNSALDVGGTITANSDLIFTSSSTIKTDTTDGADNKQLIITGAGGNGQTRGAYVQLSGNEHGNPGDVRLASGAAGGSIYLQGYGSGGIHFQDGSTTRWQMTNAGHLYVGAHNSYDIGTSGTRVRKVYAVDLDVSGVVTGTGLQWTVVGGTSLTMAAEQGYIANNAALVTLTLPSTCAVGKIIRITGLGAGGWRIAQNSGQIIHVGDTDTTTGVTGEVNSTHRRDTIEILCVVADTEFTLLSSVGTLDIV